MSHRTGFGQVGRYTFALLMGALVACNVNGGGGGGTVPRGDTGPGAAAEPQKDDTVSPVPPLSVDPPSPTGGNSATVRVEGTGATTVSVTAVGDGCGNFLGTEVAGAGLYTRTDTVGATGACLLTADIDVGGVVTTYQTTFTVEPAALNLPKLKVLGGIFILGTPPVPGAGVISATQIGDITLPGTVITGGTVQLRITLADPAQKALLRHVLAKITGAGGDKGFYRAPIAFDGDVIVVELQLGKDFFAAPPDLPTAGVGVTAVPQIMIEVTLIDAFGDPSESSSVATTPQEVGTGDVQVSLSWDTPTDVDLHVVEPSGEEIYWAHTVSATGGTLDLDSNPACSIDGVNNENIVWAPGTSPTGEYIVRVDFWSDCGGLGANYTVTTTVCNESNTFTGAFSPGTDDGGGAGSGVEITRFNNLTCQSRVRGTARYEDRAQTAAGLAAGTTLLPIRFAKVEVQRASDEAVLASGETRQDGTFDISFRNDGDPGYKVIVMSEQDNATLGKQHVRNKTGGLYAVESAVIDETAEPDKTGVELKATAAVTGPAFNILDVGVTGAMLIRSAHGATPPELNWLWTSGEKGSCTNNVSCYQNATSRISVLSIPADRDEYDDLVLLHEYGHFWQNKFSASDSPGGAHSSRNRIDPQLAWGEGSATFFGNWAKGTSLYLDTTAGGIGVRNDLETLAAAIPLGTSDGTQNGNLSEMLVAAMLWDLCDATNEANDTLSNPVATFDALGFLKTSPTERATVGIDMVDLLDAWFCRGHANRGDATSGVQGNVVGNHQFNYDFAPQASCR